MTTKCAKTNQDTKMQNWKLPGASTESPATPKIHKLHHRLAMYMCMHTASVSRYGCLTERIGDGPGAVNQSSSISATSRRLRRPSGLAAVMTKRPFFFAAGAPLLVQGTKSSEPANRKRKIYTYLYIYRTHTHTRYPPENEARAIIDKKTYV